MRTHTTDDDCAPFLTDDDGTCDRECTVCGVSHGEPCAQCGGRGFHRAGCPDSDETIDAVEVDARALLATYADRRRRAIVGAYRERREVHPSITARAALRHALLVAPWPCPADFTDAVETAHERAVRVRACAIFRAEILPTLR